jgi:hypothetical protein
MGASPVTRTHPDWHQETFIAVLSRQGGAGEGSLPGRCRGG